MNRTTPRSAWARLWAELSARRVLRNTSVYVVGTWLVLQVADVAVLPAAGIPGGGMRYLLMAAGVGLLVTVVLSWRYQIDTQGLSLHRSTSAPAALGGLPWFDRLFLAGTAVLVLGVTAMTGMKLYGLARADLELAEGFGQPVEAPPGSLAVLPFVTLAEDPELAYLGDGLAEEMLDRFTQVRSLRVTARTSAFSFRGEQVDVRKVGRALGVAHVLEGSIRRDGPQLRVAVQLVDARTGFSVWSHSYTQSRDLLHEVQEDIARAVVEQLQVELTPAQQSSLSALPTTDPEALDLYRRGRFLYQRMDLAGTESGIRYLREAIERDPSFAAAYVALADALSLQGQMKSELDALDSQREDSERRRLLDMAISLDPSNADAHAIVANELAWEALEVEASFRELAIAESLNPNSELVLRYAGQNYATYGWPPERAIPYMQRGVQQDPLNPWAITNLAIAYYKSDRFEQALQELHRAHELNPDFWVAWWTRDIVLMELGRGAEAVDAASKALDLSGGYVDINGELIMALVLAGRKVEAEQRFAEIDGRTDGPRWRPAFRAVSLAALGRHGEALDAIEYAVSVKDGFITEFIYHRVFAPLHEEPRFQAIVKQLGMERRVQRLRDRLAKAPA